MNLPVADPARSQAAFRVCYGALHVGHRSLCFPCDASGRVDLNGLPARELSNYLYARAMVGRVFALPVVAAT